MKHIVFAALAAGFIGGTVAPIAVQAAGELFGSALVLNRTVSSSFKFWAREGVSGDIAVATVQPTVNNRPGIFDVSPKGEPTDRPGAGTAWIDVCGTDLTLNTGASCGRLGARSEANYAGSASVGGDPLKPFWLTMQGEPALVVETDGSVSIGVLNLSAGVEARARKCSRRTEGDIFYQASTKRFLGCDGVTWRRLN